MSLGALIAPILGSAVIIALAYAGLSGALGAHPWWDQTVALIGAPVGAVLAAALARLTDRRTRWLLAAAALLIASLAAAHFGKVRFAASFAEDTLAGRFWYFGWIATTACTAAILTLVLTPRRR